METPDAGAAAPEPTPEEIISQEVRQLFGEPAPQPAAREETSATPKDEGEPSLLDDQAESAPETKETSLTPKQLAEKAGIDVKDVVFTLDNGDGTNREIPYADVKQILADHDGFTREKLEFEQAHQKQQNELLQARQALEGMVQKLPPDALTQEFVEQWNQQSARDAEREARLTLEAIPSWKDPTAMQADRAMMTDYLTEWGFDPQEAENVTDHRMLNFVRYHARLVKRVAELEKQQKGGVKTSRGKVKGTGSEVSDLKRQVQAGTISGDEAALRYLKTQGL